jgi:hypothetical protein
MLETLNKKLKGFYPAQFTEFLTIFTRNLKALLDTKNNTDTTFCSLMSPETV